MDHFKWWPEKTGTFARWKWKRALLHKKYIEKVNWVVLNEYADLPSESGFLLHEVRGTGYPLAWHEVIEVVPFTTVESTGSTSQFGGTVEGREVERGRIREVKKMNRTILKLFSKRKQAGRRFRIWTSELFRASEVQTLNTFKPELHLLITSDQLAVIGETPNWVSHRANESFEKTVWHLFS